MSPLQALCGQVRRARLCSLVHRFGACKTTGKLGPAQGEASIPEIPGLLTSCWHYGVIEANALAGLQTPSVQSPLA